jgi:hypothetical protein
VAIVLLVELRGKKSLATVKLLESLKDLDDLESFELGDPNTPEDYQALNIEFEYRLDEMRVDIMKEFSEVEMADLFWNNRKEYYGKYYSGWKVLEKDNPEMLKEIEEQKAEDLAEGEL